MFVLSTLASCVHHQTYILPVTAVCASGCKVCRNVAPYMTLNVYLQNTSTSAVAAITLLFTFMAAILQRLMGQAFGFRQTASSTTTR